MTSNEKANLTNQSLKAGQSPKSKGNTVSIRVTLKTKGRIEDLLVQVNKNKVGRKIKSEDIISFSLAFLGDEQLQQIRNQKLTNKDRIEILFRKFSREKKGLSKDDFYGLLLEGKVSL